jgi:hypothetical protein
LLHIYYKLTFALMQVAGRIISEPGKKVARPVDDADIDLQGKQIENRGKAGAAMLGLMHAHPSAQKVSATFYPEQETKDFRQGGEKSEGDDWSDGMALDLFLWHDAEAGEWVLEDFSTVDAHKENRAKGAEDAPVPAALFEELNSKLRFPKGALYYRCPDEASYRILRTTEPWTMADWLRMVAMAGLAVGIAVATAGAAIPAQVIMVGSSVFMAGAEVASMVEESEQGMLTTERVVVHGALIASCILGGATASLKMAGMTGTSVARVVAGLQVGADGVCVAVFSHEAFEGLKAAADDPEGVTFMRLLAFFLQMGMNGLMLYGMKGSLAEAAGAKPRAEVNAPNSEVVPSEKLQSDGEIVRESNSVVTESKSGKLGKKDYLESKRNRKAMAREEMSKHHKYNPSKRTDAELLTDLDAKQRLGESKADVESRLVLAKGEINSRKIIAVYDGLGDAPQTFDIIQNDLANPRAHTVGTGNDGRHGPAIPLDRQLDAIGIPNGIQTIEGRIYGDAPWSEAANQSSRWESILAINRTINKYLKQNWDIIRSDLAMYDKHTGYVDAGEEIGSCFRNQNKGTPNPPIAIGPIPSKHVRVTFLLNPSNPPSYYAITSFPELLFDSAPNTFKLH